MAPIETINFNDFLLSTLKYEVFKGNTLSNLFTTRTMLSLDNSELNQIKERIEQYDTLSSIFDTKLLDLKYDIENDSLSNYAKISNVNQLYLPKETFSQIISGYCTLQQIENYYDNLVSFVNSTLNGLNTNSDTNTNHGGQQASTPSEDPLSDNPEQGTSSDNQIISVETLSEAVWSQLDEKYLVKSVYGGNIYWGTIRKPRNAKILAALIFNSSAVFNGYTVFNDTISPALINLSSFDCLQYSKLEPTYDSNLSMTIWTDVNYTLQEVLDGYEERISGLTEMVTQLSSKLSLLQNEMDYYGPTLSYTNNSGSSTIVGPMTLNWTNNDGTHSLDI